MYFINREFAEIENMKINKIYDEMLTIAKKLDIKVRNDKGRFRTGFATVNDTRTILINSGATMETKASYLAKALSGFDFQDLAITEAVQRYITDETNIEQKIDFNADFNIDLTSSPEIIEHETEASNNRSDRSRSRRA